MDGPMLVTARRRVFGSGVEAVQSEQVGEDIEWLARGTGIKNQYDSHAKKRHVGRSWSPGHTDWRRLQEPTPHPTILDEAARGSKRQPEKRFSRLLSPLSLRVNKPSWRSRVNFDTHAWYA